MAMDPQMKALLLQTIYVAARSGQGVVDPTYGSPASRAARVELRTSSVKNADGFVKQTDYLIFLEESIGLHDRVWLPGVYTSGSDGKHRLPAAVEAVVGWDGVTCHYEVRL